MFMVHNINIFSHVIIKIHWFQPSFESVEELKYLGTVKIAFMKKLRAD